MDAQSAKHNGLVKPSSRPRKHNLGGRFVPGGVFLAFAAAAFFLPGCGGGSAEVPAPVASTNASKPADETAQPQPAEIVSQLLDRFRRGGDNAKPGELLTSVAQSELQRIGRPFEFPGSPDTTYKIGQTLSVPEQPDAVWVQTYLSEPMEEGQIFSYEVVWTLKKETNGWRVSGFAVDQGEGLDPLVFDFEDGDEMATQLAEIEQASGSVTR